LDVSLGLQGDSVNKESTEEKLSSDPFQFKENLDGKTIRLSEHVDSENSIQGSTYSFKNVRDSRYSGEMDSMNEETPLEKLSSSEDGLNSRRETHDAKTVNPPDPFDSGMGNGMAPLLNQLFMVTNQQQNMQLIYQRLTQQVENLTNSQDGLKTAVDSVKNTTLQAIKTEKQKRKNNHAKLVQDFHQLKQDHLQVVNKYNRLKQDHLQVVDKCNQLEEKNTKLHQYHQKMVQIYENMYQDHQQVNEKYNKILQNISDKVTGLKEQISLSVGAKETTARRKMESFIELLK
jgi:cell division septum initiation protein DivIVA